MCERTAINRKLQEEGKTPAVLRQEIKNNVSKMVEGMRNDPLVCSGYGVETQYPNHPVRIFKAKSVGEEY